MAVGIPSSRMPQRYAARTAGDEGAQEITLARALAAYADDLLETGDVRLALERAFRWGYQDENGDHVAGLQEHLQDLRHQRDRLLRHVEHESFFDGLEPELDRLDALEQEAGGSVDDEGGSPLRRLADRLEHGYTSEPAQESLDGIVEELRERAGAHAGTAGGKQGPGEGAMRAGRSDAAERVRRMLFHGGIPTQDGRATGSWRTGIADRLEHDLATLGELDRIEEALAALERIGSVTQLSDAELEASTQHAEANVAGWLRDWKHLIADASDMSSPGRQLHLPPEVVSAIGRDLLKGLFRSSSSPVAGEHHTTIRGNAGDPAEETREWEPGRPLDLNLVATLSNAVRRAGGDRSGRIGIRPEDFAIVERTSATSVSTVLAIDKSRSMGQSGAWTAAKKVSLAMHELIRQSYPRDRLELVAFSSNAAPVQVDDIPEMRWDEYEHGTHLQAALELGRRMHRRSRAGTRQIVVITDGEPTIATVAGEEIFASPPTVEVLNATMAEVIRCTRENITINIVILGGDAGTASFAEQVARVNGGRIFTATNESLGAFILRDYVSR